MIAPMIGVPVIVAAGGGALVAVIATVAALRFVRRRGGPGRFEDADAAMAGADAAIPGLRARAAVVGSDGQAALVLASDGRVVLLRPGRRPGPRDASAREVTWRSIRSTEAGMLVDAGENADVVVAGVDALAVRRLAPDRVRA